LSKITYLGYDEGRRLMAVTNANNEIIRYTNNAAGDLLSLTDGKNQTTRWNYDEYGRATNKLDQASVEVLRYKFDPNHRLTNRWSKAKGNTYFSHDPIGNLTNINYPVSPDVSFAFDPLNRLTNMVDAVGTTKFDYTAGGQLWTEDGPWSSDTVTNGYLNLLRTSLILQQPTGTWTNAFSYDAARRLTNVTSQAGAFNYSYSYASPVPLKVSLPNSSYITNTYDTVARLVGTYLKNSSHSTLNSHQYGYNGGNQRTQQVFSAGSTYNYNYDPIGQLKVADSATASEDRGYTYDTAWNLNYRTNNGALSSFSVDGKNQLTSAPGGSCTYDNNGNLTISHSERRSYVYDDENRLVELYVSTHPFVLQNATEFLYDGLGRLRIRREYSYVGAPEGPSLPDSPGSDWQLDSETRYVYDGRRVIQERDGNNTPLVSYTRGKDLSGSLEGAGGIGGLLARSHGYSAGNWSTHNFYHADGGGNITYLVNSSQSVAASYRYDPYGNTIGLSGSLAAANVYRFSSKERHAASGLYYYGERFYEPNLQRWLNRDPIGETGGINLYGFVINDPANLIDDWGMGQGPSTGGGTRYVPGLIPQDPLTSRVELELEMTGRARASEMFSQAERERMAQEFLARKPFIPNTALRPAPSQQTSRGMSRDEFLQYLRDNPIKPLEFQRPDCPPRLRDPITGRFIADASNPRSPFTFTDAQRRAEWRRLAEDPNSPLTTEQREIVRERGWRGPQQINPRTGEMETMELSHEPIPLRNGGTKVVPRWPDDHAAVDPNRHVK